jgi:uncharacterized protein YgiM (DUF1202 family)
MSRFGLKELEDGVARYRPRRVARPPIALRAARLTVPAVVIGSLIAGVTATAWPQSDRLTAVPATSASPAQSIRALPDRATRGADRPTPSAADLAAARAAEVEAREEAEQAAKKAAKAAAKAAKAKAAAAAKAEAKRVRAAKIAREKAEEAREERERAERARIARARAKAAEAKRLARLRALDLDVEGTRYTTTGLNLRTLPDEGADVISVLKSGTKVSITDSVEDGYRLVVRSGKGRWVKNQYLSKKKPAPPRKSSSSGGSGSSGGISSERCSKSNSIEGGLQSNGVKVYRALCARFPKISSFGGRRPANGGFHPSGRAVDAMIDTDNGGWEVARWLRANAGRLGVSEVIHAQKIWTVQRSSEGWRSMSDQGNATANHYDHVHVSVY